MNTAIETDPGYAMGWAVLGEIFVGGHFMGFKSKLVESQLEKAVALQGPPYELIQPVSMPTKQLPLPGCSCITKQSA